MYNSNSNRLSKKYYINVGPAGTFKPSGASAYDTTPEDVDAIFESFEISPPTKILIYFHGGLVSENSGMTTASDFTKAVLEETDAYPISFVWETGLIETITQNFKTIHKTKLFWKLVEKVIKIGGKKLGIELELPVGTRGIDSLNYESIQQELKKEYPFSQYKVNQGKRSATVSRLDPELKSEIAYEMEEEIEADPELIELFEGVKGEDETKLLNMTELAHEEQDKTRGIISTVMALKPLIEVVYKVIERHIKDRDHGFYPTVIEEMFRKFYIADLGAWVWNNMKEKASDMWETDGNQVTNNEQHAGNYLLKKIEKYYTVNPDVAIDLVGHSAGAAAICHMIKEIKSRGLNIRMNKVIFLAPACRCELFLQTVISNHSLIKDFRMFTMSDEWEIKDKMVPWIYTRSLLYFISGVLEDEGKSYDALILGLERHNKSQGPYNSMQTIQATENFMNQGQGRAVYSVTPTDAPAGFRSNSVAHGQFNNIGDGELTMQSVLHFIKK